MSVYYGLNSPHRTIYVVLIRRRRHGRVIFGAKALRSKIDSCSFIGRDTFVDYFHYADLWRVYTVNPKIADRLAQAGFEVCRVAQVDLRPGSALLKNSELCKWAVRYAARTKEAKSLAKRLGLPTRQLGSRLLSSFADHEIRWIRGGPMQTLTHTDWHALERNLRCLNIKLVRC